MRDIKMRNEMKTKKGKTKAIKQGGARLASWMLITLLSLPLSACGARGETKAGNGSSEQTAMAGTEADEEEALAAHKKLMEQENAILSKNTQLWEKVFAEADKGMTLQEDGKNYGDFLLKTIHSIQDQLTAEEQKLLLDEAEKIRQIEDKLTKLEEKYPQVAQKSLDSAMSMSSDDSSMQKFPVFEGKDLDGNQVKSEELFSGNAVTVVNFWFTACKPCVGELPELDALNKELMEKGGALIGINAFTLDGKEAAISEAKDVLAKQGAGYQNVYFDSDSEAGNFVKNVYAYPTTCVVDRKGNLVGDPIVGAITGKSQREKLQSLIDKAIAGDGN